MIEDYNRARKAGRRQVKDAVTHGRYPYLPALDEIVGEAAVTKAVPVGTINIPAALIAGTVTRARGNVFSSGFLPLAEPGSEFSIKWSALYDAQVSEGIRDAVVVYEFLQRFYVLEGNKRVSVLRWLENPTISATVKRVMPAGADEATVAAYNEFLEFYKAVPIYGFFFSKLGSYAQMARLLGKTLDEPWPEQDVRRLETTFTLFRSSFEKQGGARLGISEADAFLAYLKGYTASDPLIISSDEIDARVRRVWDELVVASQPAPIDYVEQPPEAKKGVLPQIKEIVLPSKKLRSSSNSALMPTCAHSQTGLKPPIRPSAGSPRRTS